MDYFRLNLYHCMIAIFDSITSYIVHALTCEGHLFDRYMKQHGFN